MTINIFEYATRQKIRFQSTRGELTTEQIWDVPLRSGDGFDLNAVAKAASKTLKESSETNFVETKKTVAQARNEAVLGIIKYVIETKLAEEDAAKTRAENRAKKDKLLRILAEKQDGKLSEMSEKELQRQIAALGD